MMEAAVLLRPGHVEIRNLPSPVPGPGEVVLSIQAATTCGTDLKTYRRGHPRLPVPALFGHEYSGTVVAVGPVANGRPVPFAVGDDVMAVHSAPCGECRYCARGQFNLCRSLVQTMALGAFAEQVKLPARIVRQNAYPKPEALSFAEAALLEPLACVVFGVRHLALRPRQTVAVFGAGAIGLIYVAVLKALAPEVRVIVAARRDSRRDTALGFGADAFVAAESEHAMEAQLREQTFGHGPNIAIDCTGSPAVWELGVRVVDAGGQVLFYGGCRSGTTVSLDTARVHYDHLSMKGVFHFDPDAVREAHELLVGRRVDLRPLLAEQCYGLRDVPELFARLDRGEAGIKNIVKPQAQSLLSARHRSVEGHHACSSSNPPVR